MMFASQKIIGYVVLTEDGDRPYFVHKIHPHFEATLLPSTRVYEFILNVGQEDEPGDLVGYLRDDWPTMRRIK